MSAALADPVMRDLARYEAEQDADAAREELIEARIPVLAAELLEHHPDDVMDTVYGHESMCRRWRALEDDLCRREARGELEPDIPHSDEALMYLAHEMRCIVRDAAERLARDRAEDEVDRGDMTCCELERRSHNKEISQ